mmetsp:Transcript_19515/g.24904  ORF Transcript_19515/g.24904 Transcript_19515/m.24904 type:complete len:222 (-) Transcript_19515:2429-3094(-)
MGLVEKIGKRVYHIREALNEQQQCDACKGMFEQRDIYDNPQDSRYKDEEQKSSKFFTLFGVTDEKIVSDIIKDIPSKIIPAVIPFAPERIGNSYLKGYRTSFVDCFRYPLDGSLRGHVDMLPGYALIVSLGNDAVFWFQEPQGSALTSCEEITRSEIDTQVIVVKSGDAVLFDAGISANVRHGISKIIAHTCPKFLPKECYDSRYCIQYRQYPPNLISQPL